MMIFVPSSALLYLQDDFRMPFLLQGLLLKENDKDVFTIVKLYSKNSLTMTHSVFMKFDLKREP